jgi:hypothetical protein
MLSLYRSLLRLRRSDVLSLGAYAPRRVTDHVLVYERRRADDVVLVVLNLTGEPQELRLESARRRLLLSTYLDENDSEFGERISLRANEGLIFAESSG